MDILKDKHTAAFIFLIQKTYDSCRDHGYFNVRALFCACTINTSSHTMLTCCDKVFFAGKPGFFRVSPNPILKRGEAPFQSDVFLSLYLTRCYTTLCCCTGSPIQIGYQIYPCYWQSWLVFHNVHKGLVFSHKKAQKAQQIDPPFVPPFQGDGADGGIFG